MTIRVNGEPYETAGPITISALLTELKIDPRRVAVEHNIVVIKRALYDSTVIDAGDEVEIVNFVGGGCLSSTETTENTELFSLRQNASSVRAETSRRGMSRRPAIPGSKVGVLRVLRALRAGETRDSR